MFPDMSSKASISLLVILETATLPLPSETTALEAVRSELVILVAAPVIASSLLLKVFQSVLVK